MKKFFLAWLLCLFVASNVFAGGFAGGFSGGGGGAGAGGDFVGPASATEDNFVSFNSATGKAGKDSGYAASAFLGTAAYPSLVAWGGATPTAYAIPMYNSAAEPIISTTLNFVDLNASAYNFIVPWVVGTGAAHTTLGYAYFNSSTFVLTIGNGTAAIPVLTTANIATTISDSDLTHCPDGNSVFDALAGKAATNQSMYIGTTEVAINRGSAALTIAGLTLTTPNIGEATGTSLAVTGRIDGLAKVEAANGKTIDTLSGYFIATGTGSFVVPTPASTGGNQYCIKQANNATNAITVIPVHTSGVRLENQTHTGYCTADDKLVSGGDETDMICLVALDATHYEIFSAVGNWTCTAH